MNSGIKSHEKRKVLIDDVKYIFGKLLGTILDRKAMKQDWGAYAGTFAALLKCRALHRSQLKRKLSQSLFRRQLQKILALRLMPGWRYICQKHM